MSSRICVKGLPKSLTDDKFRLHFAGKGIVTDAKIRRTRDGTSRQFGFVGYKTAEEAEEAVRYFDKTFIGTQRIEVSIAEGLASKNLSRPWSKYSEGSTAYEKVQEAQQPPLPKLKAREAKKLASLKRTHTELPDDPKLREFLWVMDRRSTAIWSNEDTSLLEPAVPGQPPPASSAKPGSGDSEDDELYEDLPEATTTSGPLPKKGKAGAKRGAEGKGVRGTKKDKAEGGEEGVEKEEKGGRGKKKQQRKKDKDGVAEALADAQEENGRKRLKTQGEPDAEEGEAGGRRAPVPNEDMSDMDYLRSRMRARLDDEDDEDDGDGGPHGGVPHDGGGTDSDDSDDTSSGDADGTDRRMAKRPGGPGLGGLDTDKEDDEEEEATRDDDDDGGDDEDDGEQLRGDGKSGVDEKVQERQRSHEKASTRQGTKGATDNEDDEGGAEVRVEDTGRLFMRNLPYTATQADLAQLLEAYGELSEVHLVVDRWTKKSKGIALATFMEPADAAAALAALDGSIFQGRLLHILPGRQALAPKPVVELAGEAAKGGFKAEKEAARKAEAGKRASWNTLYMRPDTIVQAAAALLGTSPSALMDPDAEGYSLEFATSGGAPTRKALEDAAAVSGHAAKSGSVARSSSVLLVKNLPFSTSEDNLLDVFGKFGVVERLVLPTTNTLALVEFLEAADARRAFSGLAYRRFEGVPLYLEWAPQGIFRKDAPTLALKGVKEAAGVGLMPSQPAEPALEDGGIASEAVIGGERDETDGESPTLYVKNLGFSTTDEALLRHFDAVVSAAGGQIRSARVSKKKGPDGKYLSAGFGFVECSSEAVARIVLKKLQGSILEGRKLLLQLSMRKTESKQAEAPQDKKSAKSTKLVVRNVAFEATKKDIHSLFSGFGHIRSVRLPRKFDHTPRGFAFVDFLTKQEALNAKEAVTGAHLYGRRLVIEWAEDEEGLDTLRAKTAARFRPEDDDAKLPLAKRFRLAHERQE
eukprot:jgi/Botrbrau1/14650/Bobra.0108s0011.1